MLFFLPQSWHVLFYYTVNTVFFHANLCCEFGTFYTCTHYFFEQPARMVVLNQRHVHSRPIPCRMSQFTGAALLMLIIFTFYL